MPPLYPFVQSGRLRGIAVGSVKRLALMPDLPTIAEAGVPPEEFGTYIKSEIDRWGRVIKAAGVRPE